MSTKAIIATLLNVMITTVWYGKIFSLLWNWYIVPTFHFPELTIITGSGVMLIIAIIMPRSGGSVVIDHSASFLENIENALVKFVLEPLAILATGWILTFFI